MLRLDFIQYLYINRRRKKIDELKKEDRRTEDRRKKKEDRRKTNRRQKKEDRRIEDRSKKKTEWLQTLVTIPDYR